MPPRTKRLPLLASLDLLRHLFPETALSRSDAARSVVEETFPERAGRFAPRRAAFEGGKCRPLRRAGRCRRRPCPELVRREFFSRMLQALHLRHLRGHAAARVGRTLQPPVGPARASQLLRVAHSVLRSSRFPFKAWDRFSSALAQDLDDVLPPE